MIDLLLYTCLAIPVLGVVLLLAAMVGGVFGQRKPR
jgi:uncharacterized protein YneF (UPF0154 family)